MNTPCIPNSLKNWLVRSRLSGLNIVAIATHQLPYVEDLAFIRTLEIDSLSSLDQFDKNIEEKLSNILHSTNTIDDAHSSQPTLLTQAWEEQLQAINKQNPIKITRVHDFILVGCLTINHDTHPAIIGCLIAPPVPDNLIDLLQLSLGWIFYGFTIEEYPKAERTQKILELTLDVLQQNDAKSAAQEWVNQLKKSSKQYDIDDIGISLFKIQQHQPKWWVSANIAWVTKGSPKMQTALELATITILECAPQQKQHWWSYPLSHQGHVSAVLIIEDSLLSSRDIQSNAFYQLVIASSDLLEPVLRQWQQSEQNIIQHSYRTTSNVLEKLLGKGYLAYKFITFLLIVVVLAITLIPVDDVVNAPLYLEGEKRHTITTPQQGYISEIKVRPGDKVQREQLLAKLDDKDLKLELAELTSQLNQTEGQFRQAMAVMDATNSGLAINQKYQVQAKIDLLQQKLQRTEIKSPINGVVASGDWQQKIGAPVDIGEELFQIADTSQYRIILHVPDKDMDRLTTGQQGKMRLTSLPDQTFDFTVTKLTAVAEVKDGENGFSVEASLNQSPTQIQPGMQGVGKIIVGKTNLITTWTRSLIDWLRLKAWGIW